MIKIYFDVNILPYTKNECLTNSDKQPLNNDIMYISSNENKIIYDDTDDDKEDFQDIMDNLELYIGYIIDTLNDIEPDKEYEYWEDFFSDNFAIEINKAHN